MNEGIDYVAVVMALEDNWESFCEHSGGEDSAERTLQALKTEGGLS